MQSIFHMCKLDARFSNLKFYQLEILFIFKLYSRSKFSVQRKHYKSKFTSN